MSGLLRSATLRGLEALLGLALLGSVAVPGAAAQSLDTVTATGSTGPLTPPVVFPIEGSAFLDVNVHAQTGASGENPSGTASIRFDTSFGPGQPFSGPITCQKVTGPDQGGGKAASPTTATLAFQDTTFSRGHFITATLIDKAGNGADTISFVEGSAPGATCVVSSPLGNPESATFTNGRAVVVDAPPKPAAVIDRVVFGGNPTRPVVSIYGRNFGDRPSPQPPSGTSNLGNCGPIPGRTGHDYGLKLWLNDRTQRWSAGRTPQWNDCIGLIITRYSPHRIIYRLGSLYRLAYAQRNPLGGRYRLGEGDAVSLIVNGTVLRTQVHYADGASYDMPGTDLNLDRSQRRTPSCVRSGETRCAPVNQARQGDGCSFAIRSRRWCAERARKRRLERASGSHER